MAPLDDSELLFALRTLAVCGRRKYGSWLIYGVWPLLARANKLSLDLEEHVASYI